ncbi:MAG: hypothetical protein V4443_01470 [Pseudomonadota bacterium]
MRISEQFNLQKTQAELDFVDIDPDYDVGLYIDSQLIGASSHVFADRCHNTISNFFSFFLELIQEEEKEQAKELFSYLSEPNETCLGSSRGTPAGRGIGNEQASDIFDSVMESRAIETGVLDHLEDFRIFVRGIGPDKVSDMTTNIIRKNLIEYTQSQCMLHDIPTTPEVATNPWWNAESRRWERTHETMLVINDRPILLVPKSLVSRGAFYAMGQYHRHWVLNFVKREHLVSNGPHVRRRRPKKGESLGQAYVTKEDMTTYVAPRNKDCVAEFTQQHPAVFRDFKEYCKNKARPLTNTEINSTVDLYALCQFLADKLVETPTGNDYATNYHHLIVGILELIFYPNLTRPQKEREINEGRKRIDIVFDNSAKSGQFFNLHQIRQITSPYIMVECKNYGKDVANPELDQLAGRFSANRGRFGMLLCRSVENYTRLIQRCQDIHQAQNGLIIPILDEDLIHILNAKAYAPESRPEEDFLADRIREVVMG